MKNSFKLSLATLFVSVMPLFALTGCSKDDSQTPLIDDDTAHQLEQKVYCQQSTEIVPLEDAMTMLEQFFAEREENNYGTRSGKMPKIASVDTYYHSPSGTRSGMSIPNAYIVNFENNEGYAVLGANTAVASIVAVTEKGHINPVTLAVRENQEEWELLTRGDWSCEEDSDRYIDGREGDIVSRGIKDAIIKLPEDEEEPGGGGGGTGGGNQYAVRSPMLNIQWRQGNWGTANVYNKYCYKYTISGSTQYVYSGCSTTALAQIVAYNEFPTYLYVKGTLLNYPAMKMATQATGLSTENKEYVSLLYGGIFNNVDKLFMLEEGTCITPAEIRDLMPYMGYTNVSMLSNSDFTTSMLSATSSMLQAGKPVFVSAIEGALGGHSWVIDGSMYYGSEYKLHCHWGWGGTDDGYFDPSCFNPSSVGGTYSWHYRVITYDMPSNSVTCSMSCLL